MMRGILLALLSTPALSSLLPGIAYPRILQSPSTCRVDFGNSSFDVAPLVQSDFWLVEDSRNVPGRSNFTYLFNFCSNARVDRFYPECNSTTTPAPAFQYDNKATTGQKCFPIGGSSSPSNQVWSLQSRGNPSRGVALTYINGYGCAGNSNPLQPNSFKIWLSCTRDVYNVPDKEVVLANSATCSFEIFIRSAYGCPTECPLALGPNGDRALCGDHGVCDFDRVLSKSRCFCNPGWSGDDCSSVASVPSGLSTTGGVLIGVSIFLAMALGFLVYLWFFKIARLRLDTTAYGALSAGPPTEEGVATGGRIN